MEALPVTVVGMESGTPEYFTLTSVELSDVTLLDNYTKTFYLNIQGYFGSDVNQTILQLRATISTPMANHFVLMSLM